MFRYKRGIPLEYELQGYIYFFSRRYRWLAKMEKRVIEDACQEAGGRYASALKEFVTTDSGAVKVCGKYYLSESTLERIVKDYYCLMAKRI